MAGISSLLSIGQSALSATQTSLQVTGNNISNVDTDGYSRQSVILNDGQYTNGAPGQLGSGVVAQEVVRSHDSYIEAQYLQKVSARDRYKALYGTLSSTQSVVNESITKGTNSALSTFFADWGTLSTNTDSSAARQTMLDDTQTLLTQFRSTAASLAQQKDSVNKAISDDVNTLNQLAKSIADINKQINETQVDGSNIPNGLYDERDAKIRDLASLLDVNVIDNGKGNVTVNTNAGQTIVDGSNAYEFKFEQGKTVRQLSVASITSGSNVQAYYSGNDSSEYTLKAVSSGAIGTSNAKFEVSLDGGKTWIKNATGSNATFQANGGTGKVHVGNLDIWFGSLADSTDASGTVNAGDTFTVVPKTSLYWYTSAGTPVNVTPQQYADGTDNATRLTGGALTGAFEFRDKDLGGYQNTLDAMVSTLVWETNRIQSQGAGLTPFTSVTGTYSVSDATEPLGGGASGLAFGSRLQSGASMMYVYDSSGKMVSNAAISINPKTDSLNDVVAKINTAFAGSLTASIVNNKLSIAAVGTGSFRFGSDSSGLYAALGVNTMLTGSNASDVALNSTVTTDTNKVCVGHVGSDGLLASGDNTTAKAMVALQTKDVDFYVAGKATASQTIGDYYSSFVGKIGSDTSSASYQSSYQTTLASQLEEQQLSASGVSLDEELTNLIKFQHSYQAAAKLISTADSLMETILGLKN